MADLPELKTFTSYQTNGSRYKNNLASAKVYIQLGAKVYQVLSKPL